MKARLKLAAILVMQLKDLVNKVTGHNCISCASNSARLARELAKILCECGINPLVWVQRTCEMKGDGAAEMVGGEIQLYHCYNFQDVLAIGASCVLINDELSDATIDRILTCC